MLTYDIGVTFEWRILQRLAGEVFEMHGIVFVELRHYVDAKLGRGGWERVVREAGTPNPIHDPIGSYPDEELLALLEATRAATGTPSDHLLHGFGELLAPSLMHIYAALIEPEWKTLELIEHVEETIHEVVRFRNPDAHPPGIHCERLSPSEISIQYTSERRLCALVIGIARGVALQYGQSVAIVETSCVSRGDEACTIRVRELVAEKAEDVVPKSRAPIAETMVLQTNPVPALSSDTAIGQTCGRYELLAEVGRGAMGVVYRARDPVLEREVAIKILLRGHGPEIVERFNQEARFVARLRHPGIVPVFDLGEFEGRPFFVMEMLHGVDFRQWLSGQTIRGVIDVVRQVALALHFAHEQDIIHRDVKPENIMMVAGSRPVLMDFGVARDAASSSRTEMGLVLGTPAYMSPEQFEALPGLIGAHTDIYAVGALLYFSLCGRTVFEAETTTALLRKVLLEPPVPPREVNPAIPPDVEAVILRCLEKETARRYASAADLAEELSPS